MKTPSTQQFATTADVKRYLNSEILIGYFNHLIEMGRSCKPLVDWMVHFTNEINVEIQP